MTLAVESVNSYAASDLSLVDYLRRCVPACYPTEQTVVNIDELSAGVWSVELEDGSRVVAKHQALGSSTVRCPDDLLIVEPKVLDILFEHDCSVPRPLAVDMETRFIFLEYCGDRTLDDVGQESGVSPQLAANLVAGFCQIEQILAQQSEHLLPHASIAAAGRREVQTTTRARADSHEGLAKILGHFGVADAARQSLASHLDGVWRYLGERKPTLASTDFNARNIVIDDAAGTLYFIEFAKIGWDWPERRLVQYATSLGAGRDDGELVCSLSPESVDQYEENVAGGALALDGHHIMFHLQAAAMLWRCLEQPALPRHRAFLHAWKRPRHRLRQHATALASPLTFDTPTADFRSSFSEAIHPFIEGEL